MIAALYVSKIGPYWDRVGIDPWDEKRDARLYSGPYKVIAHPPCERWGRYWSGGPSAKIRRLLGDDNGCFEAALKSVRDYGGVLEHPEGSHAFKKYGLGKPPRKGGWVPSIDGLGWVCCVEQGNYGHKARKATWLYYIGPLKPKDLIWGPSVGIRMDEGFHSTEERWLARAAGRKPLEWLSKKERIATPLPFLILLVELVKETNGEVQDNSNLN